MKISLVRGVQFCLLLSCLAFCLADSKKHALFNSITKHGLTPFVRVGRRSENSMEPVFDDVKRLAGNVMPFIRTGRSDPDFSTDDNDYGTKRPGTPTGLWFGPRLGRIQKRNVDDEYNPWTYIIFNGEEPVLRQNPQINEDIFEDAGSYMTA